ncbi:MAG: Stp1/IreP family PP2C-type Ser/Thr phosphatase [Anaerolineae bacterium]|nr:Stp1/IreP family PP2C-type Ser/Thr phosphatase [Anaerolineae bacterium]
MPIDTCGLTLSNQIITRPGTLGSPVLKPLQQADWLLLGGAGFALVIVAILVAVIVLLLLRRRRAASAAAKKAKSAATDPTLISKNTEAESPTLPSARPVAEPTSAEDDGDTRPLALLEEPTVSSEPTAPAGKRPPNIKWRIAGLTHVGLKRKLNEDKMLILEGLMSAEQPYGLYIVADGMGGHDHGEVASQLTIDTIQSRFNQLANESPPYEEWFRRTIVAANETVIAHQHDKDLARKMGSTLVMALVVADKAYIAHVGDSRAYHLTNNSMTQITEDHSLVERLIQIGQITREEARTHKQRNVIYSTIGDKAKLQIGFYSVALSPGDRLLLCSDGLTGMLTDEQVLNINRSHVSPGETCQVLVKAANGAGGEDNITVILVEMDD